MIPVNRSYSLKLRAYLLMVFVVAVWGGTFVLIKDALTDITPLLFNLLRMLLAFACLAVVYRGHWRKLTPRIWVSGAVVGLFLAIGYQFQTAGLALTTPSKSAFITGMVVVLVPLLSAIPILRPRQARPPGWTAFLGALLAFAGILLLTTPATGNTFSFDSINFGSINKGDILTFFCALGFALHCLALGRTAPHIPFEQLALLQIGFAAIVVAITTPLLEHPQMHATPRVFVAIAIAAVLATAAAFSIQSWAQQILPASHTALILTLEPVFAWLTSFVVLHERLSARASIGAVLILSGIAAAELIPAPLHPTAHEAVPIEE